MPPGRSPEHCRRARKSMRKRFVSCGSPVPADDHATDDIPHCAEVVAGIGRSGDDICKLAVLRCLAIVARGVNVRIGSFATGWNQRQVQPCPLFADRGRSGEPLNPTFRGHGRTSEMPRRVYPASKKPIKRHHVVVAGPNGISSVKLVPREEVGSVSSPPSCFESALTKRVPSRLLVVES